MAGRDVAATQAWVTLATNESYALGALVLANSLIRSGTTRSKVVMISDGVGKETRESLTQVFDHVVQVTELDSGDVGNLALLERPELGVTFTKLHCWKLTQYTKCVFLDSDTLVIRHCDELFDREELSAAPDAGWPDCFNSGVFVYRPSENTFKALMQMANEQGSFDGGDQGLLNVFFRDWMTKDIGKHLSFLYNMCATATYTYLPAYKRFGQDVKIVHFIGASKPWHVQFDYNGRPMSRQGEEHTNKHLKFWWQIYHTDVKKNMSEEAWTIPVPIPEGASNVGSGQHTHQHQGEASGGKQIDTRERWEDGAPDYLGGASFDNILKVIKETMSSTPDK